MNLKVRQDASNPFSRSFRILSLGLLEDDASEACTLAIAPRVVHARIPGLNIHVARLAGRAIVLAERADPALKERLRLDVHGMPDGAGSAFASSFSGQI